MSENTIKRIVEKWQEFTAGEDDGWVYDMSFEFFEAHLSRGEYCQIMDYLQQAINKD